MTIPWRLFRCAFAGLVLVAFALRASAAEETPPTAEQLEFFENRVRPILTEYCYECHSGQAKAIKGGLRLDSRAAILKGGDSGCAVVPGKPEDSPLVRAIRWQDFEMPPRGKLRRDQVDALVKWIELGAPWPEETAIAVAVTEQKVYDWDQLRAEHWAFQSVQRPALPTVLNGTWPQNEIDYFVLARLEAAGLSPAVPASPAVLIRRLYFDLIGLPPTPSEIDAFVQEYTQAATVENAASSVAASVMVAAARQRIVDSLVDRLLDSPHYGERWGRHWLDVARYSDGYGGFLDAAGLPQAWRYRDWVVDAINRDLPFDEFVRLQLAGDLIAPEQAVATGFLALGPSYKSDGGDPDAIAQAMSETLDDRVDTLSRGLFGLTVSCARCHDHKFDPIPQLDYYSLAGVFKNSKIVDSPLASPEAVAKFDKYQKALRDLESRHGKLSGMAAKEKREPTDDEKKSLAEIQSQIDEIKQHPVESYAAAHALAESGSADMQLAVRGNLRKPGPIAPRRFLRIVKGEQSPLFANGSGRLELANAVVDPRNPLTARVIVNRIFRQHFGQGLVRTPSNFGKLGEPPTHPELLDWLAAEFVEPTSVLATENEPATATNATKPKPWSLRQLHRRIVLSAAYQMSSEMNSPAWVRDADNRLLWRMNPRRLDVEAWRDALLAVTDELDRKIGGPKEDNFLESRRRTLYMPVSRSGERFESDAFLRLFDFPPARATNEGRLSSVVPQQSLFLMNSPFMIARARKLATRLQSVATDDSGRIEFAYRLLYARPVSEPELQLGLRFLQTPAGTSTGQPLSSWEQYAQVLLSANEFMHVE